MKTVDYSCDCKECVSRTKEMYELLASCGNCGEKHIAQLRKGDRPYQRPCPACGVSGQTSFGTIAQARAAREQEAALADFQRPGRDTENVL